MQVKKNENGKFRKVLDFSEIENDKYIQKWLDNIKSKRSRLSLMQKFCNFVDKTPSELAKEHQEDLKIDVLERENIAKKQLNAFFGYLTDTNDKKWKNALNKKRIDAPIAWNSAIQYVFSKLLSFYSRLGIPVIYKKKDKPNESKTPIREKTWRENGNMIKHIDKKAVIKQISDSFNSLRDRAILLSKISSSLDDVDLFNLKINHFTKGYMPEYNICYLQGERQKDGMLFQTFFSTEACSMIKMYLKDRKNKLKIEEIPEKMFLFAVKGDQQVIPRYFTEKMKEVVDKLELGNITPKSLRRWFNSHLEKNSIMKSIIGRLMGHKGDIRDEHYNDMFNNAIEGEREELAKYYAENIDALVCLGNGSRHITKIDKKIENLTETIRELSNDNAELKESFKNISEMMILLFDNTIEKEEIGSFEHFTGEESIEAKQKRQRLNDMIKYVDKLKNNQ